MATLLGNSSLAHAIGRRIPAAAMSSDIADVVYINFLLEAERLEPLVARPLQLQRLGPDGGHALFSILTFRHGSFGPTRMGRLRPLWPSPIQSNWRIHVVNPATGARGVQFLTTAITSTPHALVTRLLTEGVPMHVPASASCRRDGLGAVELGINPGAGTAPDLAARLVPSQAPALSLPWSSCFASWRELLAYCVPQDQAMCVDSRTGRILRQRIELGIPLESCRPMTGDVHSVAAERIVGAAVPLCFAVDHVGFRFVGQVEDR